MDFESLLLQSALVARLRYDERSEQVSWSGYTEPFLPYWNNSLPSTLAEVCARLKPASSNHLKSFLKDGTAKESFPLDFLTRRPGSNHFFVATPGTTDGVRECFFHVLARTFDRIDSGTADCNKSELDRTEEGHHRAKNILQSISSYLNLLTTGRECLPIREVDRVIRYVHVLAALHDVLHDQLMTRGRIDIVRLDRVFQTLFSRISLNNNLSWNEIPILVIKSARAASLCLLMNEIMDLVCPRLDPEAAVIIQIEMTTAENARVEISRAIRPGEVEIPDLSLDPGMSIIKLLTKADPQISFDLAIKDRRLCALLELLVVADQRL